MKHPHIEQKRLESSVWMFNHYRKLAHDVWDFYKDISNAAYMFDYYSEMMELHRSVILALVF